MSDLILSPPAQGMLHKVITLPEGCGPLNVFHLRLSDIVEQRNRPAEQESGGVFESGTNVSLYCTYYLNCAKHKTIFPITQDPPYILPPSTFVAALEEEILANRGGKPQITRTVSTEILRVLSSIPSPILPNPGVKFVECGLDSELSVVYTGKKTHVCWEDAGISLYLPTAQLEKEINISIKVINDDYILPLEYQKMPMVSSMYRITASETLPEPVKIRMEHCIVVEKENILGFMVAHGEPPYRFSPLSGGVFPLGEYYGEIELNEFSIFTIIFEYFGYSYSTECAVRIAYCSDSSADFVVTQNLSTHIAAMKEEYKDTKFDFSKIISCSSSSAGISLTVPRPPKSCWNVEPACKPAKIGVNAILHYRPGQVVPHIKLKMKWEGKEHPHKEDRNITVDGTQDLESFMLTCGKLLPSSSLSAIGTAQQQHIESPQPQSVTTLRSSSPSGPIPSQSDRPTLPLLLDFPTKSGHMNIIEKIGVNGHYLCIHLLNDECGSVVNSLEEKHRCDPNRVAETVLVRWLNEKPRTWADLVRALKKMRLVTLAEDIEQSLCTTDSNQVHEFNTIGAL